MKKYVLKCVFVALASTCIASAATVNNNTVNPNNNLNNMQAIVQSQAASTQNATNSLIRWLNANFVTGMPIEFSESMKNNLQTILANYNLNDLNWLLTQNFTYALLSGANVDDEEEVPSTTMKSDDIKAKIARFNIGSLLSTTTIKPNSSAEKNSRILLQFVSGLNNSVSALPSRIVSRGMGPISEFQSQFGTYVAQQSVGLNVLYGLLNERLVKSGLGTQLGGPEKDMSPLALEQYSATRRLNVNNPKGWLAQMSDATPAQVSKEQLMLMAEMRYEMYLTRRSLEQMSMLIAVQQLQSSTATAEKLQRLKSDVMSAGTANVLHN